MAVGRLDSGLAGRRQGVLLVRAGRPTSVAAITSLPSLDQGFVAEVTASGMCFERPSSGKSKLDLRRGRVGGRSAPAGRPQALLLRGRSSCGSAVQQTRSDRGRNFHDEVYDLN